jgi:hypothetical protein
MNALLLLLGGWSDVQRTAQHISMVVDDLCFSLCAVFGLIGGLRIYNKWQLHGRHHFHIDAEIAGWFGASLFFLAANVFIDYVF